MKKLYLFLVTAIVALCGSFAAEAATGGTISWNYPGAVEIYTWTSSTKTLTEVSLDANATSYTVEKKYDSALCVRKKRLSGGKLFRH